MTILAQSDLTANTNNLVLSLAAAATVNILLCNRTSANILVSLALVPAGTGFKAHLEAEVRIRPEALEALADKGPAYARYRDEATAGAGKD